MQDHKMLKELKEYVKQIHILKQFYKMVFYYFS